MARTGNQIVTEFVGHGLREASLSTSRGALQRYGQAAACLVLPIGFYTYPGAIRSVSFNAGTYYQWPV